MFPVLEPLIKLSIIVTIIVKYYYYIEWVVYRSLWMMVVVSTLLEQNLEKHLFLEYSFLKIGRGQVFQAC